MKKSLLLFSVMAGLSLSAQTTATLVACYGMNGNGTDAVNAINGSTVGTSNANDRFNNATASLLFNGSSSSYMRVHNDTRLKSDAMTISLWARPGLTSSSQYIVFAKNTGSSNFEGYSIVAGSTNKFIGVVGGAGNVSNVNSTTTYTTGTWYHLALSFNSNSLTLYVNGSVEGTSALGTTIDYDTTGIIFGGSNLSFNLPYTGHIDNVRIYKGNLSASEISQIYTNDVACGAVATGINSYTSRLESVVVFPNPARDMIDLHLSNDAAFNYSVSDLTGKVLLSGSSGGRGNTEISVSDLPKGVYLVNVVSNDLRFVKKLIKE